MPEIITAFEFISQNSPLWINSLEELENTIKERQAHVAQIPTDPQEPPKKIKKSGSNESIRPRSRSGIVGNDRDDDVAPPTSPHKLRGPFARQPGTSVPAGRKRKTGGAADSASVISTSDSLLVNNNGQTAASLPAKYRSRSMVIVYYDSEIQKSFEQIVRHIGTARNNIRRARTSERMERLAMAVDMSSDDNLGPDGSAGGNGPLVMFRSTRSTTRSTTPSRPATEAMRSPLRMARTPVGISTPQGGVNDAFSEADASLEHAQSLCERGAHTFLREGDCEAEIAGARENFEQAKRLADRELIRLKAEQEEQQTRQQDQLPEESADAKKTDVKPDREPIGIGPLEADDDGEGEEDIEDIEALLKMPRYRLMART